MSQFTDFVQPHMGALFSALGLDIEYTRAEGNTIYHRVGDDEVPVLDLMGGYGSLILGHNHPELVAHAKDLLDQQRPMHAQFSVRGEAGRLAAALNSVLRRETGIGERYLATFGNSGAEAVEAAIKHAELVRVRQATAVADEVAERVDAVERAVRDGSATVGSAASAALNDHGVSAIDVPALLAAVRAHNEAALAARPLLLALERSFHGKLVGSVQATYNDGFRTPFRNIGPRSRFVSADSIDDLDELAQDERVVLLDLSVVEGQVRLSTRELPSITAFLVEPVQGEGGIHALTEDQGRAIRKFCNRTGTPLVIDEVQSGVGRCGAFLASSLIGLRGDYYALSKSLGGGITKNSAMLVRESLHQGSFDVIHSSTFAADDHSCGVARKVVELLEADSGRIYRQVAERGERLHAILDDLREQYPDVIQDVRGKGLFLGVQLHDQSGANSVVLRSGAYSGSLGYQVAGYLLRSENIRIAPTGSASNVLRMQPSAFITDAELERIRDALERVCRILRFEDTLHLVHASTDQRIPKPRWEIVDHRPERAAFETSTSRAPRGEVRKVAFLNHLIDPELLRRVDPALRDLSDAALRSFVHGMEPVKVAAPYPGVRIESAKGTAVDFALYPLMVDSEQMSGYLASGDLAGIRADIAERVQAAREDGCEVAGLGMYTSIVTNNATALSVPGIALTTGNALTVAMGVRGMERAAAERGWNSDSSTLVAVGAAGNIASVYCQMFAARVSRIVLVGSKHSGSQRRLRSTVHELYADCWNRIASGGELAGIASRLAAEPLITKWLHDSPPSEETIGKSIAEYLVERYGADPFLTVTQDEDAVREGDFVLCAANSPKPFLNSGHFAANAVVCDIAVPNNAVSALSRERPDLHYSLGGIVGTPNGESLHQTARASLDAGQLFACMAETAVLGLAGVRENYSYGPITRQQVTDIANLADEHGFYLSTGKKEHSL